jgi:hypothetical protein
MGKLYKVFHNARYIGLRDFKEISEIKKTFRNEAVKIQKETKAKHVVYYRDERNIGGVDAVIFYDPIPYNEEKFEKEVVPFNSFGILGVVHSKD